jgi:hypothetical protein
MALKVTEGMSRRTRYIHVAICMYSPVDIPDSIVGYPWAGHLNLSRAAEANKNRLSIPD